MKALSVRQPWAWAILHAGKRLENRDWDQQPWLRAFRGRVLLHASKGCTRDEYEDATDSILCVDRSIRVPPLAELPRGAIVGAMTITGCVRVSVDLLGNVDPKTPLPAEYVPWAAGPWGLVLEHIVALPRPVPCKGALSFWTVPPDVALAVREMARAA